MFVNRFIKYLATEKGRNLTKNTVVGAGVVTFCANYVPNTMLVNKFKDLLLAYKQEEKREVPEKLQRRFEYAMDLCKCTEYEKNFLEAFMTFGFDTMQLGSTKSRFGAHIGIPTNYLYDKISDIERPDMRVRNKEVDWSSDDGNTLQHSLVLTEIEQVFGIARSILMIKLHKLMLESLYPPVCIVSMYVLGHALNHKMKFHAGPLAIRLCMYSLLSVFGYGLYSFMTDFTQVHYETRADSILAEMAPELIDTGITFYDKLLKKNVALRNLTGENIYSASGNENYVLRQKSLPLTIRKAFFEMKKKELEQATADSSSEAAESVSAT